MEAIDGLASVAQQLRQFRAVDDHIVDVETSRIGEDQAAEVPDPEPEKPAKKPAKKAVAKAPAED